MHTYLVIPVKEASACSFFSLTLQTEMMTIPKHLRKYLQNLNCSKFNSVLCSYSPQHTRNVF